MTEIYYHAGSFKFSKYLDDGTLVPISVLNDGVDSVTFKDGTWTTSFDSSFDFSDKPITPIISLNTEDSDGNDITWNHTLENIVSSKVITKVVGGDGIYTVSPTLDLTDSASIEKSLSENNIYKFTGTIASPTKIPKTSGDSNSILIDKGLIIRFKYNVDRLDFFGTNLAESLKFMNMTSSPDVLYDANKGVPLILSTTAEGLDYNSDGTMLYIAQNTGTKSIQQYQVPAPYDYRAFVGTEQPIASFDTYTQLGISNGEANNSSYLEGVALSDSENRMFVADRGHNKIYQYELTSPGDILTTEYLTNYYENTQVAISQKSNSDKRRNTRTSSFTVRFSTYYGFHNSYGLWRNGVHVPGNALTNLSQYPKTNITQMSADGKHYYLMDHLRIKYFELTIPYNISSAQYVSTHTFSVTSTIAKSGSPYRSDFIHWYQATWSYLENLSTTTTTGPSHTETQFGSWSTSRYTRPTSSANPPIPVTNERWKMARYIYMYSFWYSYLNKYLRYFGYYVSVFTSYAQAFTISADGNHLYVLWGIARQNGKILQYDLSVKFDVSTATKVSEVSHRIGKTLGDNMMEFKDLGAISMQISSDGQYLYILDTYNKGVHQYTMSVPWALSTIETDENLFPDAAVSPYTSKTASLYYLSSFVPTHMKISANGAKLYISDDTEILEYNMSTNYMLSTATQQNTYTNIDLSENLGFDISGDSTDIVTNNKIFLASPANKSITQFKMTGSTNDSAPIGLASLEHNQKFLDLNGTVSGLSNILLANKGTEMYLSSSTTNQIYKYNLSDSNEIYSATFDSAFSTSFTNVSCMHLNTDETKMFIGGGNTSLSSVREYDLNKTAGSFKNSAFNNDEYILSGVFNRDIRDISFNSDGSKFQTLTKKDTNNNISIDTYTAKINFNVRAV